MERRSIGPLAMVQALRAFAALAVLVGHTLEEAQTRFAADFHDVLRLSWLAGVDIFFVISGFIMVTTSWNRFAAPGAARLFLVHRFVRVVPLYWLFTALIVLTILATPGALGATQFDPGQIVSSYLFWPYRRHDGEIQPALSVGWTLNYEMFFYCLFSVALLFRRRTGLVLLSAVFIALPVIGAQLHPTATPLVFWTDPIIIEFAYGAAVGALFMCEPRLKLPAAVAVPVAVAMLVLFMAAGPISHAIGLFVPRVVSTGIAAILVVLLCTVTMPDDVDRRTPRFLQVIGDASYSIYLSHRFGLRIATLLFGRLVHSGAIGPISFTLGTVIVCTVLGQVVHVYCERPMMRFIRRRIGVGVIVDHRTGTVPAAV